MKRLRGVRAQLLLFIVLPLILSTIALGSVFAHERSMRRLVGERDLRAVRVAAAALSSAGGFQEGQHLEKVLAPLQSNPAIQVMLVDARQRIVYSTEPELVGQLGTQPGVVEALDGLSGLLYSAEPGDDQELVIAYAPITDQTAGAQQAEWALVVAEPWGEALSPWLRASLLGPLILLPAIALALSALWWAMQRVIRPLQRLDTQVAALSEGDLEAMQVPTGGIQEIQELQHAIAHMAVQLQVYQARMRSYLGVVTAAQEDERKRLARELHDQTIQDLIALRQRVQMARRKIEKDPAGTEARLAELQSMLETTMEEVRRFSRALRPMYLEEAGLVAALQALARDARQEGLQVSFQIEGKAQRLAPEIELALYRIIQAALQNTIRHSRASKVSLSIEYAQGVTIRVRDDGIGFVVPQRLSDLAEAGHYGLMGMQERAQLVAALFSVTSQPGDGTEIDVRWLPADSDHRIET